MVDKRILMNTLRVDLNEALHLPFFLGILGVVVCFVLDNFGDLHMHLCNLGHGGNVLYFVFNAFSFGGVFIQYLACICSALPFAASYSLERQGKMTIYKIARCGNKNYARSKMLVAALSGGIVLSLGVLFFILALSIFFPYDTLEQLQQLDWLPYTRSGSGSYFAVVIYMSFLSGAIWGSAGMCVSAFIPSPYVAICSPMILCFIMVELGRMLKIPGDYRFDLMLRARAIVHSEVATLLIVAVVSVMLCYLFYRLFLKKVGKSLEEVGRC